MKIKVPYITTSLESDIIITLYLARLWWVLGFSIFIYHVIALWGLNKLLVSSAGHHTHIEIPRLIVFPVLLTFFYGLSLIINFQQNEPQRTVASIYNFSFWIMGLILILVVYNTFTKYSLIRFANALGFNIAFIGILSVISILLWMMGIKNIGYRTPLLITLPSLANIPLLKYSATIGLINIDWFANTSWPRLKVLGPYSTAVAASLIMMLPLFVAIGDSRRIYKIIITGVGIFALLLTLSRTAIIAFFIAIIIVYIFNKKHRIALIIALLLFVLLIWPVLTTISGLFSDLRKGSSDLRLDMYRYTIETVMRASPIIGIGVKPREHFFMIPVGSHSMYLSFFLKAGVLGLISFLGMQWYILKKWIDSTKQHISGGMRLARNAVGISLIAMCMWMATEDLDAPQLVAYLYFLLIGIFAVLQREALTEHGEKA